jgi:hypothetical protein
VQATYLSEILEMMSVESLIISKEVFYSEGKALFRADHSVAHRAF